LFDVLSYGTSFIYFVGFMIQKKSFFFASSTGRYCSVKKNEAENDLANQTQVNLKSHPESLLNPFFFAV